MSSDELPIFVHGLHNLFTISSAFLDVLLLLVAANNTKHMKSYSIFIVFQCMYEILAAISTFIIFPRVIPLGSDGIVVVVEGPCRIMPARVCFGVYSVLLNAATMFQIQMAACFLFRYFVLRYPVPSTRQTTIFNALLAIPSIICTIIFNFGIEPRNVLDIFLQRHVPQYDLSAQSLSGIAHPLYSPALPSILFIIVTSIPCIFLNIWSGLSIKSLLDKNSANLSNCTQKVHRQFLSALVWHLIISQWFTVGVVAYVLEQFDMASAPVLEYAVHMSGGKTIAVSPLVTLYFVKPYRGSLLSMVRLRSFLSDTAVPIVTSRTIVATRQQSPSFSPETSEKKS